MKSLIRISTWLLPFVLIIACEKENGYDYILEIPVEDRCTFKRGDTILYICSDGSTDTACIKNVVFRTITRSYTTWFGGTHNIKEDKQKVVIEVLFNDWNLLLKNILTSPGIDTCCYTIENGNDFYLDNPRTDIVIGCESPGKLIAYGLIDYNEITFNNKEYRKVYYYSGEGYNIYWNLKYGIIRFKFFLGSESIVWDLEGKI